MSRVFDRRSFFLSMAAFGLSHGWRGFEALSPVSEPEAKLDWFLDAGYGLFVHWGPYSLAGVEASWPLMMPDLVARIGPDQKLSQADYESLAERFDPQEFDPREWVRFARQAGMRYLVITAKHHDGYCLFDSPSTDYKITRKPGGRDLLRELADACAEGDLPLGFYYSPPDMHHPGYRDTSRPVIENWMGEPDRPEWSQYLDAMEADLRKLLSDYGEIAILWFDGLFDHSRYQPERFHRLARQLQPGILINDRLGANLGDYITPEQNVPAGVPIQTESGRPEVTAEQFGQLMNLLASGENLEELARSFAEAQRSSMPTEIHPARDRFQPWETCMTLGVTWAYDPLERGIKSPRSVARTLVEVASRGGNLLLNVGPMASGRFPESAKSRLLSVGRWLERNGEAIYGTTWGPLQGAALFRTTLSREADRVFVHLLERPEEGVVRLVGGREGLAHHGFAAARRLGDTASVPLRTVAGELQFDLPSPGSAPEPEIDLPVFELL